AGVRAHGGRGGRQDPVSGVVCLQRGLQVRQIRVRGRGGQRHGHRHRPVPVCLPAWPGQGPGGRTQILTRPLQDLALLGYVVFLGFPLLFLLSTSLKSPQELQSGQLSFFPRHFDWANFGNAIEKANLAQAAGNSLYVAALTTVIVTVVSLPAAYA